MSKKTILLLILALASVIPVSASPVPTRQDGLSPEQIKAGCTLDMVPPFRPECHAQAGKGHSVHAGASPSPFKLPDIDFGCEFNGHIIPDCHLIIGHRPQGVPRR